MASVPSGSNSLVDTGARSPPQVITYRLGEKLVYVEPAPTYAAAVALAFQEFSDELDGISPHRITFSVNARLNGEKRPVRISEGAWSFTVNGMITNEVVNVVVAPESDRKDYAPPPHYLEVSGFTGPVLPACGCSREPTTSASSCKPSKRQRSRGHWRRLLC
ncbi:hypothetical protein L218DRAFT_928540 [Marasmius fiardii PR-910]|nr:hypothetical protein L218DRAFT_928540 [Marasmius fiardii PR-910]